MVFICVPLPTGRALSVSFVQINLQSGLIESGPYRFINSRVRNQHGGCGFPHDEGYRS